MSTYKFYERLQSGQVLVSDGATGTNLQKRGLVHGTPSELWVLEKPDEIMRLHREFVNAGSDVILTNTFGGSPIRLAQFELGERAAEINQKAVGLAKKATEGTNCLIAGSIGPTGHLLKPLGPLEVEDAMQAFSVQAKALVDAGVDLIVVETQFDMIEAVTAVKAVKSISDIPLVCSFSFDRGTRTMMGVKPENMAKELTALGVSAVGINCGRSLEDNISSLKAARAATDLPIWFKPNAGLPKLDDDGNPTYDISPEDMGNAVPVWIEAGANIIGGCCGTSPEHLKHIALAVKAHR